MKMKADLCELEKEVAKNADSCFLQRVFGTTNKLLHFLNKQTTRQKVLFKFFPVVLF
jgi:hypothetical protein